MDSIIQSDVFFFITTVVVVCIGILAAVICISIIGILRHVKQMIRQIKTEAEEIISDVHAVRGVAKNIIKSNKNKNGKKTAEK